ncbi:MAG: helix-turn-helix domain-containing protein [Pseudonocardiaceae bacterium]|nr:helix-turn-helix domain-containing protein [Pseudonocardiaceae bacterium]
MSGLRVLSENSADGWWEMVSHQPDASLRGVVRSYTGYREYSTIPVRRKEIPGADVGLILSFGPTIRVLEKADTGVVLAEPSSFVAELGTRYAITEYRGEQHGVQLMLTPLGAGMVLGMPLGVLEGQAVELTDLLGAPVRRLIERLAETPTWEGRFAVLDAFVSARLSDARRPSPAAAFVWRRLCETDGRIPIGMLVDELGCSHRYLLSEFTAYLGIAPKSFARILRARRARRLISEGTMLLRDVAMDCGYSDQAHLSREFRAITGESPSGWHPRLFPD